MADEKKGNNDKGQPQPNEQINSLVKLFDAPLFQTTTGGKVFTNSDGSSSRRIAAGECPIKGTPFSIPFNVYGRKSAGPKPSYTADVSFVGARNVQALMPRDERGKAELTDYKGYLAEQFRQWRKGHGTITQKVSRTAVDLEDAEGLFAE